MKRGVADRFSASEQLLADRTNESPQDLHVLKSAGEHTKSSSNKLGHIKILRDLQLLTSDVRQRYLGDVERPDEE